MIKFRRLKPEEIDCRAQTIKKNGLSLLLYKDARVDMNILDETVGALNWKRSHEVVDGRLCCTVSLWDNEKLEWVSKQDVGTESMTEKDKGQFSDSFKRACFNVGIGRELYSAPFIWISSKDCTIKENANGKLVCNDGFTVTDIGYDENGNINNLKIRNNATNRIVFRMGAPLPPAEDLTEKPITEREKNNLKEHCKVLGVKFADLAKQVGWQKGMDWNAEMHGKALIILKEIEDERVY